MRCRWDMQDHPPDILITNFCMLSVMLMRDEESPIFEKTKAWLEGDKNRIFHLVIDELHMYRGTAGTEVAYLIRLLLSRLGLKPGDKQLRILSSSASLVKGKTESEAFIKDFFGLNDDGFEIIGGKLEPLKTLGPQTTSNGSIHQTIESYKRKRRSRANNDCKNARLHWKLYWKTSNR